jgi:hypothetical protein
MSTESEKIIFAKLAVLEDEIGHLRRGYTITNKRYADVLTSLKSLTELSTEATQRAALSAQRAANAANKAANQHLNQLF